MSVYVLLTLVAQTINHFDSECKTVFGHCKDFSDGVYTYFDFRVICSCFIYYEKEQSMP